MKDFAQLKKNKKSHALFRKKPDVIVRHAILKFMCMAKFTHTSVPLFVRQSTYHWSKPLLHTKNTISTVFFSAILTESEVLNLQHNRMTIYPNRKADCYDRETLNETLLKLFVINGALNNQGFWFYF